MIEEPKKEPLVKKEPLMNTEQHFNSDSAKMIISYHCDSYYFMISSILKLLYDPNINGKEYLKKKYGDEKKFSTMMNNIMNFYSKILKIKAVYDLVYPKNIVNLNIEDKKFVEFQKILGTIPIIHLDLIEMYYDLVSITTLSDKTIKNSYIDRARRDYKKFEYEIDKTKEEDKDQPYNPAEDEKI